MKLNWNFQRGRKGLEKQTNNNNNKKKTLQTTVGDIWIFFGNIADPTSMQDAYELSK